MERGTKLLVLASLGAAYALTAYVGSVTRPELPLVLAAAFAAGFLATAMWPGGIGGVLACSYVAPAIVFARFGEYPTEYHTIWTVALVGAIVRQCAAGPWMLPRRWRVPLVGWAVAVAVTWPLIVAREVDFNPAQLTSFSLPSSSFGIRTPTTVLLILEAAITLLASFVWLDWLFSAFSQKPVRTFERRILAPLLVSCAAASIAAAYQLFGDIRFLNADFSVFGRAAGTMVDANAYGTVAAVWCGVILAWAMTSRTAGAAAATGTTRHIVTWLGVALMLAGVWASGSKTSLVAAMIIFAFVLQSWFRAEHGVQSRLRRGAMTIGVIAGLVLVLLIVPMTRPQSVPGATQRLWWIVPGASGLSIRETMKLMWDRDGYGVAAARMFRQTPIFGVGVGTFPILVSDYGRSRFGGPLLPDNAQNWIRHQLTELGILGSLGWLIWACVFAHFMVMAKVPTEHAARIRIIRGILVAIMVVSLVGMPTQNAALALTVWTLVFWYAFQVRSPGDAGGPAAPPAMSWKYWALAAVLILAYAGGTLHLATTTLRVPMRARQFGWSYDYGFYLPEPDGRGGEYRWAQRRAVAVFPAPSQVVKLTLWSNRHDIAVHPVHARAWHDDHLVVDVVLHDINPVTTYLVITSDPQWFMLTTEVDRVIVPTRLGGTDSRELGLAVEWSFLDKLPTGSQEAPRASARF